MKGATLITVLLFGLAYSSAIPHLMGVKKVQQQPVTDIMDVITGLIKGLELDTNSPGACATDLTNAESDIQAVISDIERIIGGDEMAMLQLLTDGEAMLGTLEGSNSDCKWSALLQEFESLTTEAGQKQILSNVMSNMGEIFADAKGLATCPTDLTGCGFQVAQIFRLVFNWGIQMPRPVTVSYTQVSSFFSGFLTGIETPGSNGSCVTDVEGLSGQLQSIESDVEKALTGNVAAAISAFEGIKKLLSSVEGFNGDCNFSGLVSAVESLGTPAGWVKVATNFMQNLQTITTDAGAFMTCGTAPTQCGFSLGQILTLTLGWSLGPSSSLKDVETTWFDAFLQGLQNDPNSANECVTDLNGLSTIVQQIIADIEKVANDYSLVFQLIADAKTLVADLQSFEAPCNIPDLISILQSLTTPSGVTTVVNNFKTNIATIMTDAPALMNCSADIATCGENAGVIVRLVLGWSI